MKSKRDTKSLLQCVDSIFAVSGEMIADNGEDSYLLSLNDAYGIVCVFDGCGGLGSRKYAEYENKSGAYIASRIVSKSVLTWFETFSEEKKEFSNKTTKNICDEIKQVIIENLKAYEQSTRSNGIKGSMTKNFPTTASIILFAPQKNALSASYIWAGDSRGFILTTAGLTQITKDDIEIEGDALENISNDSKLTNVISSDSNFILNSHIITYDKAGIFLTATDGCFGYYSTPMEFEYMLLDTLLQSDSIDDWSEKISDCIKKYTADDYTLGLVVFGFKNFKKMKKAYEQRHKSLYQEFIKNLDSADEKRKLDLWNTYKENYYRGF